jgi:hypothetical protein
VSLIALDKGDMVYSRVKPRITDFMGEVFEKLCIEYMWSIYDELPFAFQNVSRWWGNNPNLKSQAEVDFIAYDSDGSQAIFGECKWRNEYIDKATVERLMEKCQMFKGFNQKRYYLFSKTGFTSSAREFTLGRDDIHLIEFKDMFE